MRRIPDPNLVLAATAAVVVALEATHRAQDSIAWLLLQSVVAAAGLVLAWLRREELRLVPVLGIVVGLQLALIGVHFALDVVGDKDSSVVYRWQGNGLLRGDYPRSEYPVGAVLLFAFEAWLGGGSTRWTNGLLMAPFGALVVACVWLTRTALAPWLAAVVALWPANAFYWQYKFDLAPAALLALGLLLATRGRWALAGGVLAAGTLVKWVPALAFVALLAWLLARRRLHAAFVHAAAFVAVVVVVHVPFLLWNADHVAAAYERQSGRSITPESLWYLLLRPFGLAEVETHISFSAGAPRWANLAAGLLQAAVVLALVVAASRAPSRHAAVALAALTPAAFLLTNRIFSPQFMLVAFAAWAVAAALVLRNRRQQLLVGVAMALAAGANQFVYPFALPAYDHTWPLMSAVLFATALTLTGWLAGRAIALGGSAEEPAELRR